MLKGHSPHVTVIILNHNGKEFLGKCLTSVFKNNYPNFDVILVDNASSDGSLETVKKKFSTIKIISNKIGLGFAGGFNKGIEAAKGQLILLLSNDTRVKENFIKEMVEFYLKNNFQVISPREASYEGVKNVAYTTKIDLLGHNVFLKGKNQQNSMPFYLTGVSLFFNKVFYKKTGGMDSDFFLYCEDVDWFWRIQLFGFTFSYADTYINHFGAGSSGGTGEKIKPLIFYYRNRNTLQMLIKNYSLPVLTILLPFYILQNIFEIIFFLFLLKPNISITYIESYIYIFKNLRKIIKKRRIVQNNRCVSDSSIIKNMYFGFGKIYHLKQFYAKK